jgi:hypothetical protein
MDRTDIVLNYLTDNEKGMQQLITWFLNDGMNEDVAHQGEKMVICACGRRGAGSRKWQSVQRMP